MSDGDNDTIAGLESELEAARKELEEAKELAEKQTSIAENAEAKFDEWSNEIGEIRKQNKELVGIVEGLKKAPTITGKNDDTRTVEEQCEELEDGLDDDGEEFMTGVYESADETERQRMNNDPEFRLAVLQKATEQTDTDSPSSGWKRKKKEEKPDQAKVLADLFDRASKRATQTHKGGRNTTVKQGDDAKKDRPPEQHGQVASEILGLRYTG